MGLICPDTVEHRFDLQTWLLSCYFERQEIAIPHLLITGAFGRPNIVTSSSHSGGEARKMVGRAGNVVCALHELVLRGVDLCATNEAHHILGVSCAAAVGIGD